MAIYSKFKLYLKIKKISEGLPRHLNLQVIIRYLEYIRTHFILSEEQLGGISFTVLFAELDKTLEYAKQAIHDLNTLAPSPAPPFWQIMADGKANPTLGLNYSWMNLSNSYLSSVCEAARSDIADGTLQRLPFKMSDYRSRHLIRGNMYSMASQTISSTLRDYGRQRLRIIHLLRVRKAVLEHRDELENRLFS